MPEPHDLLSLPLQRDDTLEPAQPANQTASQAPIVGTVGQGTNSTVEVAGRGAAGNRPQQAQVEVVEETR